MANSDHRQELGIKGMTCAACVRRVETGLRKLAGVTDVSVNLATERVVVEFQSGPSNDQIEQVSRVVAQLGYEPVDLVSPRDRDASSDQKLQADQQWNRLVGASLFSAPLFLIAMVPMVFESAMSGMMTLLTMEQWNWVMMILAVPVQFGFGWEFIRKGWKSLIAASPDMNALVLLGTLSAFTYSTVATVVPTFLPPASRHVYFEASAVVITLVLLGKYLEMKSRYQATDAMKTLFKLVPKMATVIRNNAEVSVPASQVKLDDELTVRPGEAIAVDGVVLSGATYIDESLITGESVPTSKTVGDQVIAGTINGSGSIRFRATAIGDETVLAKIVAFVETAQSSKPRIQGIADRVTAYFVPILLGIAMLTALAWIFLMPGGSIDQALIHAVSVLIIACPCAMGLAVPTSVMVGTGRAAQLGILFRSTEAIERLSRTDIVAFDKTGTLTIGKPSLRQFCVLNPFTEQGLLPDLSIVEQLSEHPLANAIVEASTSKAYTTSNRVVGFEAIAGAGVEGLLSSGDRILIGSHQLMRERNVDTSRLVTFTSHAKSEGAGYFFVAVNEQPAALGVVSDALKPSSSPAIHQLLQDQFQVALVSGDNQQTAISIANELGISKEMVFYEVRPNEKAAVVKSLQKGNRQVAFVGDGLNDAPALTVADVGIAMGTGTDLAIESADVIAMSGAIDNIPRALRLSQSVMKNIKQNLVWAFGYNIVLIPVATGFFKPWLGISLSPVLAGLAMSLSSFFVVTNSLRLRNWK